MKLRSITLTNVRRFTETARIDGFGDGLNVLCEPNEHGKSTLFDAVQALFFRPHGSRDREVAALRPHAGGAPEVTVEIETGEGRFAITKRWFSKPAARVEQNGRLIAQADEAEAWIGRQLGGGDGGPAGLLWVRQGVTGLDDGNRREQEAALEARRDLLSSVTGEVEAMTGGRRMDAALARCRGELADYATATGRPKAGGAWKAAEDRVAELTGRRAELAATAEALQDALARRKRCRRELAELADPEAVEDRRARLEEATARHRAAERHAEEVETEARKVEAARLAVTGLQGRLETLRAAVKERSEAGGLAEAARAEAEAARVACDAAEAAREAAQSTLDAAQARHRAAEEARRRAQSRQAAKDGAARREELTARIAKAEEARRAMEAAGAQAKRGPDAKGLRRLEELAAAVAQARAIRDGAAAQLVMAYSAGREGFVRRDGASLPGGRPIAIPDGAELVIEGIGTLTVRPGAGGRDDGSVDAAEGALRKALGGQCLAGLDEARAAAEARAEAERRHGEARAAFALLAPDGLDALREALLAIPPAADDADGPELSDAEAAMQSAEAARVAAQAARDAAAEGMADARSRAARCEAAEAAARDRLERASASLERFGDASEERLTEELGRAATALETAEALHAEKARAAPDLAAAEAALARARSVDEQARAGIARLRPEIATLDERIARSSGEAVEERLAETGQQLDAARAELARIEREVAVLQKLDATLEAARAEARERYFEPVAAELKPLLQLLWPDAELAWGDRNLLPTALIRDGQEEPVEILSGGTREQVALLVRLAFARMLARGGRHAPVILDDALVFTDDDRIERMFDALHRQAGDLQIIVLSCRQRAFRGLGGRVLRFAGAEAGAEAGEEAA